MIPIVGLHAVALMVEAFDRGSPLMRYMFLEFGMKSSVTQNESSGNLMYYLGCQRI